MWGGGGEGDHGCERYIRMYGIMGEENYHSRPMDMQRMN